MGPGKLTVAGLVKEIPRPVKACRLRFRPIKDTVDLTGHIPLHLIEMKTYSE